MIKKRHIITALGIVSVLLASLFVTNVLLANPGGEYDPWIDTNDDGIIDIVDVAIMAYIYGTEGTPINKTDLLLELEARIDSLNASLLNDYYNISDSDDRFVNVPGDTMTGTLDVPEIIATLVRTTNVNSYDKLRVWDSPSYTIGMHSGMSLGYLNGYATTFTMADFSNYGWVWRGDTDSQSDGAMSLTTDGKLYVKNDATFGGTVDANSFTMNPTTRYYSVPTSAWMPQDHLYEFVRSVYLYAIYPTVSYWRAPINLPDGAVVTEFRPSVFDNDGAVGKDIDVYLRRQYQGSAVDMAHVWTTGQSGSYQDLSTTIISGNPINNQNYAYYVVGILRTPNINHRLFKVRITYTINEPLP